MTTQDKTIPTLKQKVIIFNQNIHTTFKKDFYKFLVFLYVTELFKDQSQDNSHATSHAV